MEPAIKKCLQHPDNDVHVSHEGEEFGARDGYWYVGCGNENCDMFARTEVIAIAAWNSQNTDSARKKLQRLRSWFRQGICDLQYYIEKLPHFQTGKRERIRCCASCERVFLAWKNRDCPSCDFAHYGARFVYGNWSQLYCCWRLVWDVLKRKGNR